MVGLAGEGQNFDGNGPYVRFQTGGGTRQVSLGQRPRATGQLFGNNVAVAARQPAVLSRASARRTSPTSPATSRSCRTSTARPRRRRRRARLAQPAAGADRDAVRRSALPLPRCARPAPVRLEAGGPQVTAIRKHLRTSSRSSALIVLALVVVGRHPRPPAAHAAGRVPLLGKDFYEVNAELSTAQAVTPGQGQTVNIAGVQVGEISSVELVDGKAIVGLDIERKYAPVYSDATVLLRPKTGLKDMVAELTPGTRDARASCPRAATIPISQTLPDVNLDEVLAVARRRHARLPAAAARRRRRRR